MQLVVLLFLTLGTPSAAMRLVLQRVKSASVSVDGALVSSIDKGLVALVGLCHGDTADDLRYCAKKLLNLKLWANENDKMWRKSVKQLGYEVLLVSQFTLYGDVTNKKHVPDYAQSMKSEPALAAYNSFKQIVAAEYDEGMIKDGVFGAKMDVSLVNDGPVTLVVDSPAAARADPADAAASTESRGHGSEHEDS